MRKLSYKEKLIMIHFALMIFSFLLLALAAVWIVAAIGGCLLNWMLK